MEPGKRSPAAGSMPAAHKARQHPKRVRALEPPRARPSWLATWSGRAFTFRRLPWPHTAISPSSIWMVMGAGAICLGLTFAKLARLVPVTGGPYAYTRLAYGDFPGFLIAWGYWISIWASLPVIAVGFCRRDDQPVSGSWTAGDGRDPHARRDLAGGARKSARGRRRRHLRRSDDLREAAAIRRHRAFRPVLHRHSRISANSTPAACL